MRPALGCRRCCQTGSVLSLTMIVSSVRHGTTTMMVAVLPCCRVRMSIVTGLVV